MAGIKSYRSLPAGIPPGAKDVQVASADAVRQLQAHAEQLQKVAPVNGHFVTGVLPSGAYNVTLRHSLDRPYVGGFIATVDVTPGTVVNPIYVLGVDTVAAAFGGSVNPRTHFVLITTVAAPADYTVKVWLF